MKSKSSEALVQVTEDPESDYWVPQMPKVLHTLSNKLLPIVAFSDLGSRRCEDPQMRDYFDKIRQAASDSRELIVELRRQFQQSQKNISQSASIPSDEKK